MTLTARLAIRAELIEDEGIRLRVYNDSRGIPTVGIGRNLRDRGLTYAEVIDLNDHDLDECEADCLTFPWFALIGDARKRALINLRFNLGAAGLRTFKKFIAAMNALDFPTAAAELMDSRWFRTVQPSRSRRIIQQILTGDDGA